MLSCHQVTCLEYLWFILAHSLLKGLNYLNDLQRIRVVDYFGFVDQLLEELIVAELERKVVFDGCDLVELFEL